MLDLNEILARNKAFCDAHLVRMKAPGANTLKLGQEFLDHQRALQKELEAYKVQYDGDIVALLAQSAQVMNQALEIIDAMARKLSEREWCNAVEDVCSGLNKTIYSIEKRIKKGEDNGTEHDSA
jgi:cobalamin biosynthesis Mg chelatase CobN